MEHVGPTKLYADAVGVFQGGGCRAAAYAGAFAACESHGVHFAALAGTSAGSIAAVLIAAGADPTWMQERLGSLNFGKLLLPPARSGKSRRTAMPLPSKLRRYADLVQYNGMYSSKGVEEWVEARLRELVRTPSGPRILFRDLRIPVTVVAADTLTGMARIYGTKETPDEVVSRAVRASCSIPFFFQPMGSLVDGGLISNLPAHVIQTDSSDRHPILAFTLIEDPETTRTPENVLMLVNAVSNTVVQGGQAVQAKLQPHITQITIPTGDIRATDFERIDEAVLRTLQQAGYDAVADFFRNELVQGHPEEKPTRTYHEAETLDVLASELLSAQDTVLIAMPDTKWVFELYTAIMLLRLRGVHVSVALPEYRGTIEPVLYQRALLRALGCRVQEVPAATPLPIHAFVFDHGRDRRGAVVFSSQGEVHATVLRGRAGDEATIQLVARAIDGCLDVHSVAGLAPLGFGKVSEADLVAVLKQVDQYRSGTITLEKVELAQVDSWARYAHAYKQRQQEDAAVVLREAGLESFEPFLVLYANGQQSLALPPIVEATGDSRFTVVNGLTRLLLLAREGRAEALCAVVRDVADGPPASTTTTLSVVGVRVGRRGDPRDRYEGFSQGHLRHVEQVAHTLELLGEAEEEGSS